MGISVTVQEGFGEFGAQGSIPSVMDPGGAFGDAPFWIAQYIPAVQEPARLKSMLVNCMRTDLDSGLTMFVPYFVAIGPQIKDPQQASIAPIPTALFQTNFYPRLVPLPIWQQNGYMVMEAGVMDFLPFMERTWSEHEIVAVDGQQIVVACGTPMNSVSGGQAQTAANSLLWMGCHGYNDIPVYNFHERSLGRFPS